MKQETINLMTSDQVIDRLNQNYRLLSVVVEQLYRSTLRDESVKLRAHYLKLTGKVCPI